VSSLIQRRAVTVPGRETLVTAEPPQEQLG